MWIYHDKTDTCANKVSGEVKRKKHHVKRKKGYKSTGARKHRVIRMTVSKPVSRRGKRRRKARASVQKKKLSKKNIQFLKNIGLKVK